jgi:hypothetical protein
MGAKMKIKIAQKTDEMNLSVIKEKGYLAVEQRPSSIHSRERPSSNQRSEDGNVKLLKKPRPVFQDATGTEFAKQNRQLYVDAVKELYELLRDDIVLRNSFVLERKMVS